MPINLKDFPDTITNIYYLSNSPSYLYNLMRQNSYVQTISDYPTAELIEAFKERSKNPISSISEMAITYAILIALTFKPLSEVGEFLKEVEKIKYEWFKDIVQLFLSDYKTTPIIQSITFPSGTKIESNTIFSDPIVFP